MSTGPYDPGALPVTGRTNHLAPFRSRRLSVTAGAVHATMRHAIETDAVMETRRREISATF